MPNYSWFGYAIVGVFSLLFAGWMALHGALRDAGKPPTGAASFSLSRTLLLWWSAIILGCWFLAAASTGAPWEFNRTCLILMGISATTTGGARVLDQRTNPFGEDATTATPSTGNFLLDILNDGNGISIHRYQTLVINAGYGIWFVSTTVSNLAAAGSSAGFPDITSPETFGLLGLSAATYLALKGQEPSPPAADPGGVPGGTPTSAVG